MIFANVIKSISRQKVYNDKRKGECLTLGVHVYLAFGSKKAFKWQAIQVLNNMHGRVLWKRESVCHNSRYVINEQSLNC